MNIVEDKDYIDEKYKKVYGLVKLGRFMKVNSIKGIPLLAVILSAVSMLFQAGVFCIGDFSFKYNWQWLIFFANLIFILVISVLIVLIEHSKKPQKYLLDYSILSYIGFIIIAINSQYAGVMDAVNGMSFKYSKQLIVTNLILIPVYIIGFVIYEKYKKNYAMNYGTKEQQQAAGKISAAITVSIVFLSFIFKNVCSFYMIVFVLIGIWILAVTVPRVFFLIIVKIFYKDGIDLFKYTELASGIDPNEDYPLK